MKNKKRIKEQKKPSCSVGTMFICWNTWNRVAIGLAIFEDGIMVDFRVDYDIARRVLKNFITTVPLGFIKSTSVGIKITMPNEAYWNRTLHIHQNGIVQFEESKPTAYLSPKSRIKLFNHLIRNKRSQNKKKWHC